MEQRLANEVLGVITLVQLLRNVKIPQKWYKANRGIYSHYQSGQL